MTDRVLEDAEVSRREFDMLKIVLKVNSRLFIDDEMKMHPTHYKENLFDAFVDFTKLPKDMPKEAKDIFFRPKKMARLAQVYRDLIQTIENFHAK